MKHLRSCIHLECYNDEVDQSKGMHESVPVVIFVDHITSITIEDCSNETLSAKNATTITLDTGLKLATPVDFATVMEMIDKADVGAMANQMQTENNVEFLLEGV